MGLYASLSDDFYINVNLNTEMDLPTNRESVLHLFEQLQKRYPTMTNFYSREQNELVLEEEKDRGHYRWASVEKRRICSGHVNPGTVSNAMELHSWLMDAVPYSLSVSPLDCESFNLMYGFDFNYSGNHNELLADALGAGGAFEPFFEKYRGSMVAFDPQLQFALDEDCRTQCRVSVETRTTAYHVKTKQFPEEQISVFVTMRYYGSLQAGLTYSQLLNKLTEQCHEIIEENVADQFLNPIRRAIEIKSSEP